MIGAIENNSSWKLGLMLSLCTVTAVSSFSLFLITNGCHTVM